MVGSLWAGSNKGETGLRLPLRLVLFLQVFRCQVLVQSSSCFAFVFLLVLVFRMFVVFAVFVSSVFILSIFFGLLAFVVFVVVFARDVHLRICFRLRVRFQFRVGWLPTAGGKPSTEARLPLRLFVGFV